MQNNKQEKAPLPPGGGKKETEDRSSGVQTNAFKETGYGSSGVQTLPLSYWILHSSFFTLFSPPEEGVKNSKYSLHSKLCQLLLNIGPVTHFR